jgi:CheY-like chemotaxis protein
VLVIDDDADTREVLRQLLETFGARAIVAQDGQDALPHLTATPPDLIFCDLLMPRMDGFAFIAHARLMLAPRRTPVVAITALGTREDVNRTWAAGFDGHLVKPIDFQQVLDWLAAVG